MIFLFNYLFQVSCFFGCSVWKARTGFLAGFCVIFAAGLPILCWLWKYMTQMRALDRFTATRTPMSVERLTAEGTRFFVVGPDDRFEDEAQLQNPDAFSRIGIFGKLAIYERRASRAARP